MSADIRALNLRLPADLHRRLGEAAAGSGRSLNAEIVHRLAESFEYVDVDNAVLEEMSARMTTIEQAYREMTEELARAGVQVRREGQPLRPINQDPPADEGPEAT